MSDVFYSLDEHLGRLPLLTSPPIAIRRQLAAIGARLWNISAQMISIIGSITHCKGMRDLSTFSDIIRLVIVSAFALFMLDCAAPSHGSVKLIHEVLLFLEGTFL